MSARMELHIALCMRLDAREAYRLEHAHHAEVLRKAADAVEDAPMPSPLPSLGWQAGARWAVDQMRRLADERGKDTQPGESTQAAGLTVYRASHDSIAMGLYTTAAAAGEHCEAEERSSWPTGTTLAFDWIEDEEDGVAELVVVAGQNEESTTGYVVTALEVASAYDPEAEE